MVARFREGVMEHIVPVAARLKEEQARRIGEPEITVYDDSFEFPKGNAKPAGSPEDIFAHGKKMYHELSPETAVFIDFMLESELFDVLTRPGKSSGGYCYDIVDYKAPFIFANFNGTSGDIDVLTHEAGHAFADYSCRDLRPSDLRNFTAETAEVHSMSMEFFTWPWMDGFFGESAGKYRYSHLSGALTFIPYGVMVDEFQHIVYQNPDMTPGERNAEWLRLESRYRPWLKLSGVPFYGEGRRWQAQGHIYSSPFYYIDYCLAQTVALAFWAEDRRDHPGAWERYKRFLSCAGTKTFTDTVSFAGLPDPFDGETLKNLARSATQWLDTQPSFE
jgi:M3 family oligoendopeptidase